MEFERKPGESSRQFAAFKVYLGLGPDRTLAATRTKVKGSRRSIEKWSKKFGWVDRVRAFEAHMAELERLAIERVAQEKAVEWWKLHEPTRRKAWLEAEQAIDLVREARERWQESGRIPGFEGMARMLELSFKLKQFAAGMPSEIKEVNTTVTGKVSVEWEAAILKAYKVAEQAGIGEASPAVVDVEVVGGQKLVAGPQPSPAAAAAPSPTPVGEGMKEVKP
jgi:hypothetical protein